MPNLTLERIIAIASEISGAKGLHAGSAIDQDMLIAGGDVEDFAQALANEFGTDVWQWPWQRFASMDEGLPLLFPFMLIRQLILWPFRGSFSGPSPFERLELGHIAVVVDNGEWSEP